MDSYDQRPHIKKIPKALIVSICLVFLSVFIDVYGISLSQCYASVNVSNDVSFSLNIESLPLKKACEIIKNETDYKIIFDTTWQDMPITLKLDNVPLSHGLKRIIKMTGIKNYALVQHSNEIRILSFDSVSPGNDRSLKDSDTAAPQVHTSTAVSPSLILADMQALKKKSDEYMINRPKDVVVTPPSSSGNGLTLEELEALKQANKEEMENIPQNTVVTPPSNSGKGLTVGELEALNKINNQNMERRPKGLIVTPPSESGTGLTLEELEGLQNTHK